MGDLPHRIRNAASFKEMARQIQENFDELVRQLGTAVTGGGGGAGGDGAQTSDYLVASASQPVDPDTIGLVVVDSTSGSVTLSLPASPTDGAKIEVKWFAGSNPVIVSGNGKLLDGSGTKPLSAIGTALRFTYVATTVGGWVIH